MCRNYLPEVSGPRQALRYLGREVCRMYRGVFVLLFVVAGTSCAEELDVPTAPDFSDVLEAYADPNAEVSTAIMATVGDQLLEIREQLIESDVFDEILEVIVDVQRELDENTDENGDLAIPGLGTFPNPNAVIEIDHTCGGWDPGAEQTRDSRGSLSLTMVLNLGDVSPVVWGEAARCRFLTTLRTRELRSSYDGEIAVHFGEEPIPTGEPLRDLLITFVLGGALGVEDREIPIERSFRLSGNRRLEILWVLESGAAFVYLFDLETLRQGIRDLNCTGTEGCSCSLEEQRCDLPSGTISW